MRKFLLWCWICSLELCMVFAPSTAYAVPSIGVPVSSTTAIINKIINSTPGMNIITTSGSGVSVAASGTATATGGGLSIPVGTAARTGISIGRIAGVAAKAIRFGGWVGIASVVIPWLIDNKNMYVCPPPDFFCKPGPPKPNPPKTGGWNGEAGGISITGGASPEEVCRKLVDQGFSAQGFSGMKLIPWSGRTTTYQCAATSPFEFAVGFVSASPVTCPAGTTISDDGFSCMKPSVVPATEEDIGNTIEEEATGNPGRVGDLYGAMANSNMPMFSPNDNVTVTVPPSVTTRPSVSTDTVVRPDGSIDTIKKETSTEVKPSVTGSTLGDTVVNYPATTTTTTTTTNNVTNVTTVTTNVTNNYLTSPQNMSDTPPATPPAQLPNSASDTTNQGPKTQFPTDYNREVTQQKILDKLSEPITAEAPTGEKDLGTVTAKIEEGTSLVSGITAGSVGIVGWFPKVPTTACRDPQVPNAIGGGSTAVPICDSVNIFSKFISAVICVFALYGCVREVQSALKA